MKKAWLGLLLALVVVSVYQQDPARFASYFATPVTASASTSTKQAASTTAQGGYQEHHHQRQITDTGRVIKLLKDDNKGSCHQRFVLRLSNGQTLLVAHNIDLAPYLTQLKVGDTVVFSGEYIWNDKGGVLHWTHHDPKGKHAGGWLKHNGQLYQ